MATLSPPRRKAKTVARPKLRPIAVLGHAQRTVLDTLAKSGSFKTAVELRDALGKTGDQGTRATHAVLLRLGQAGYVERVGAQGDARTKTGAVVRFKITAAGRAARKAR